MAGENEHTTKEREAVDLASALFAALREIVGRLDELSYAMLDHPKIEPLLGIIEELQAWGCKATAHDWTFDQCGYWQHQYCLECREAKYPDLAKKNCGQLSAEMGKMTEAEFLAANAEPCGGNPSASASGSLSESL